MTEDYGIKPVKIIYSADQELDFAEAWDCIGRVVQKSFLAQEVELMFGFNKFIITKEKIDD